MDEDWADRLRQAGHRVTPQRRLVLETVTTLRHATPDQVHEEAQRQGESLDLSTVYRTLELLNKAGLITHVHLGAGSPTYHSLDDDPHVHLVCRSCGRVDSVDAALLTPMTDGVRGATQFNVDAGHLVLHGVCSSCHTAAAGSFGTSETLARL